jgi:iron complex outermembrane receptor protein
MRNTLITASSTALLAGTALVSPQHAHAADSAAQAQEASAAGELDEVIVTAGRREQSVTSVPYNISAVSAEALTRNGVTDILKLARSVPGVAIVDRGPREAGMNNTIVIRGIATGGAGALTPAMPQSDTVSTYIGEAPLYVNMAIKDVERVEILRGPQGTLYGSGSLGGTIRFLFNRPDPSAFSASLDGSAAGTKKGSLSESGDVVLNIPLGENLALRTVGSYSHSGGYVDQTFAFKRDSSNGPATNSNPANILSGAPITERRKNVDSADIYFGRVSLRAKPSEDVDLQLNYQYQRTEVGGSGGVNPDFGGNNWYEGSQRILDPLEGNTHLVNLDASVDFGFATLTSSSSYYNAKTQSSRDNTGAFETAGFGVLYLGNPRFIAEARDTSNNRGFVQELRLASNGNTRLQYVLGAFHQNTKRYLELNEILPGYSQWRRVNGTNPFGGPLPPNFQLPNDADFITAETQRFRESAAFGELTFNITDRWQVTGGTRFFWQRFNDQASLVLPQTEVLFGPGQGSGSADNTTKNSDHIFKANTSYAVADSLRVYATFSQGFRRGGANALPTVGPFAERAALNSYKADQINNYEIGFKGRVAGVLSFSTAVYKIDWKDIQLFAATPAAGQPFVANGGRARSKGFEFEANWKIADPLSMNFGYAYSDAKLRDNFQILALNSALTNQLGGVAASGVAGSPTPGTPKHSLTLAVDYRHALSEDRAIVFHIDGNYRSKVLRNLASSTSAAFYLDGYSLWNPSISYESSRWSVSAYVDNVFDAHAISSLNSLTPAVANRQRSIFIARPITAGLRFNMKFGEGK